MLTYSSVMSLVLLKELMIHPDLLPIRISSVHLVIKLKFEKRGKLPYEWLIEKKQGSNLGKDIRFLHNLNVLPRFELVWDIVPHAPLNKNPVVSVV